MFLFVEMQKYHLMEKPRLTFRQIWNMTFGFLGIQMGFALQNANASRILQTFGADVEHLSWFWLVAPVTGMIVQPVIGHYSDNTWNALGRRKPYFLFGAIMASIGLILMPNSYLLAAVLPPLWIGAGLLMIMDASFNIAMEPFRALMADKLPSSQQTLGFSVQTLLIGIGAVLGSWLPYLLFNVFEVNDIDETGVPRNVKLSFLIGAVVLIVSVLVTVVTTKEYSPEMMRRFNKSKINDDTKVRFSDIFTDLFNMPRTMRQLGVVQFFTWFAFYSMWVFTTPALAQHVWGLSPGDTTSSSFNEAADYVGVIFGVYNLTAACFAMVLPLLARRLGRKTTHSLCLSIGGLGLVSMIFVNSPDMKWMLNISMVAVGIAWASVLAMPYAILSDSLPQKKIGVYMGLFNFFITFPQILNGIFGGMLIKYLYNGNAVFSLVTAGLFLIIAAIAVQRVRIE